MPHKINFTVNIDDKLLPTTAFGIEKFVEKYACEVQLLYSNLHPYQPESPPPNHLQI